MVSMVLRSASARRLDEMVAGRESGDRGAGGWASCGNGLTGALTGTLRGFGSGLRRVRRGIEMNLVLIGIALLAAGLAVVGGWVFYGQQQFANWRTGTHVDLVMSSVIRNAVVSEGWADYRYAALVSSLPEARRNGGAIEIAGHEVGVCPATHTYDVDGNNCLALAESFTALSPESGYALAGSDGISPGSSDVFYLTFFDAGDVGFDSTLCGALLAYATYKKTEAKSAWYVLAPSHNAADGAAPRITATVYNDDYSTVSEAAGTTDQNDYVPETSGVVHIADSRQASFFASGDTDGGVIPNETYGAVLDSCDLPTGNTFNTANGATPGSSITIAFNLNELSR